MKTMIKKKKIEEAPASCYTSIHKLPLDRFVDALVDKNLQALAITGNPSEADLMIAWDEILNQYESALGSQSLYSFLDAWVRVQTCQLRYNRIVALIAVLQRCYVKEFADKLCRLTQKSFQYDPENLEAYKTFLKHCENRNAANRLQLNMAENELTKITEGFGEHQEPTREEFLRTLITLSDHAGRDLSFASITVFEYCERLKRYTQHIEKMLMEKQKAA